MIKPRVKESPMLEYNANNITAYKFPHLLLIAEMVDDFKPCPFCGDSDDLSFVDLVDVGSMAYSVTCNYCNVTMSNPDLHRLLAAWNQRLYTDNLMAEFS